jgi:hypothetical protein
MGENEAEMMYAKHASALILYFCDVCESIAAKPDVVVAGSLKRL